MFKLEIDTDRLRKEHGKAGCLDEISAILYSLSEHFELDEPADKSGVWDSEGRRVGQWEYR